MDHTEQAVDPIIGEPKCPHCEAVGDQPHGAICPSRRGWKHAVKPDDQLW